MEFEAFFVISVSSLLPMGNGSIQVGYESKE